MWSAGCFLHQKKLEPQVSLRLSLACLFQVRQAGHMIKGNYAFAAGAGIATVTAIGSE